MCGASTVRADGRCRAGRAAALHSAGVCALHWSRPCIKLTAQSTCKCIAALLLVRALPGSPRPRDPATAPLWPHHVDA
jgi:hypothetical protein